MRYKFKDLSKNIFTLVHKGVLFKKQNYFFQIV